jgi:hypothetical protein
MFWTWGRDAATATGDLEGRAAPVDNGYAELRTLLSSAARPLAVVSWHWDLACAIWLWLPEAAMAACCDRVAHELDALGSRLGPGLRWELRID